MNPNDLIDGYLIDLLEKATEALGEESVLAEELGVSTKTITSWYAGRTAPTQKQYANLRTIAHG
jgi:DNA-binding transcriptional regulator YiaG